MKDDTKDQCECCLELYDKRKLKAIYIKTTETTHFICPPCYGKAPNIDEYNSGVPHR